MLWWHTMLALRSRSSSRPRSLWTQSHMHILDELRARLTPIHIHDKPVPKTLSRTRDKIEIVHCAHERWTPWIFGDVLECGWGWGGNFSVSDAAMSEVAVAYSCTFVHTARWETMRHWIPNFTHNTLNKIADAIPAKKMKKNTRRARMKERKKKKVKRKMCEVTEIDGNGRKMRK